MGVDDLGQRAVLVRIVGRVQGVAYRAWTIEEAQRRGLAGWVRNRRDGSVEALLSGSSDAVDAMVTLCHRGPPAARVTRVAVEPSSERPLGGFLQRETL
ncbi:MAG: acylphosphatase [Proteobacteria bacterium]|nr:acylphosphatase [Pseudomonadota bacterium]MBI3496728.1 acylphosphatase [Pseudomonadota bacterium]